MHAFVRVPVCLAVTLICWWRDNGAKHNNNKKLGEHQCQQNKLILKKAR